MADSESIRPRLLRSITSKIVSAGARGLTLHDLDCAIGDDVKTLQAHVADLLKQGVIVQSGAEGPEARYTARR